MATMDKKDILLLERSIAEAPKTSTNIVVGKCLLDELLKGYTWALDAGYTGKR